MGAHIAARALIARHGSDALAIARRELARVRKGDARARERWDSIVRTVKNLIRDRDEAPPR